jgi:radical SAM superfamily enzyme YgiQ (UPF0313 family)
VSQLRSSRARIARRSAKAVCFIIPPSGFLLDERVFMSLGLLKVAAVCERAGWTVEVLDLSGVDNYLAAVEAHLQVTEAEAVGLTSTTPQMPAATEIIRRIRELRPDLRIILGGPHPTLVHAARRAEIARRSPGRGAAALGQLTELADVVVAGDGEEAVAIALSASPPPLLDADDPRSALFQSGKSLTEGPFAARHLVDVASYRYTIDGFPATSLIAQLGCPFSCGFCGGRESPMLRRIRLRSSDSVLAEIEHLHREYGFRGFMFYDDELNVNPKMVELMNRIADLQDRLGVEFRLRGFVKSELFTDAQAQAMARAGFRWILTGFESGSPRILTNINKKATREDNDRCLATARRHGLKVKALMSIGHPGESAETVESTRRWLLTAAPDEFDLTIITTYPGTPYFDRAIRHPDQRGLWVYTHEKTGDRLYSQEIDHTRVADYYKGDPQGGYRSFVHTDHLSPDDLVDLRGRVEAEVREALDIPFHPSGPRMHFEHSMGQSGPLPPTILRRSEGALEAEPAPAPARVALSVG